MEKVTIYTKYNCVQCKMTKKFLEAQGIAFKEVNIEEETQYVDELKANGYRQTPVVAIEGMPSFSGFRPDVLKKYPLNSSRISSILRRSRNDVFLLDYFVG